MTSLADICEGCTAKIPPSVKRCEYCGTYKVPPSEPKIETPRYAFAIAIGLGLVIILIAFIPVFAAPFIDKEIISVEIQAVLLIVSLMGFVPIAYYAAGFFLARRWPVPSGWTWSLCVLPPIVILLFSGGRTPGLLLIALFLLPVYLGARSGKKAASKRSPRTL